MKLKKHREDVKDLKLMQDNYVQEIAGRVYRLILWFEYGHDPMHPLDKKNKLYRRILKDAEK